MSGEIALCKLRLKDTKVFKNRKTDVMIGSDDNSDIVVGWTLATVDTEGCTVASILNVSGGTLSLKEGQSMARCAVIRTANFNSCNNNLNLEMTCDNDRVEAIKSYSSYSTCSPDDVLSNWSEFPTDGLQEEVKRTLPDIERLKERLNLELFRELERLLKEFEPIFQQGKADFGRCSVAEHEINLEPGAVPWKEGPRKMTPFLTEKANEEIRMLIELGLIELSYSPWASGIVMAKKKGNQLRMCCDFRNLNAQTVKDAFPFPRVDECIARLGNAKFFTCLDLADSHQEGR